MPHCACNSDFFYHAWTALDIFRCKTKQNALRCLRAYLIVLQTNQRSFLVQENVLARWRWLWDVCVVVRRLSRINTTCNSCRTSNMISSISSHWGISRLLLATVFPWKRFIKETALKILWNARPQTDKLGEQVCGRINGWTRCFILTFWGKTGSKEIQNHRVFGEYWGFIKRRRHKQWIYAILVKWFYWNS